MNSHQAQSDTPTPPPRGAPGSASAESKECMPNAPPPHPPSLGKGTRVRRLRRQLYRQWRQLVKGNILPTAPDNALVKGGQSLRAVKRYHQQGHTTARAFKHLILRYKQKEGKQRQQQPLLTTPPLPYGTPIRIATQNVQSMAELLKHQSVLDVIQARAIDVLFLTETHATKYHQFRSQQHLFVVNGNHRDKYAGVTAVLHPRILPFLKEINQHSTRIIQVTLSVASGDIHLFGVYAPHNKHDLELVKHPFWNTLETIIAKLPLPEPVYVLGDLNVRLQGRKPDETPILGPYVYGKGRLSINNEEGSNRQLYTTLLHNHQLVDALTFKQPRLLRHVTYRDKNPPPTSWSPFVLDPMGWTQFWDKLFVLTNHEDLNLSIAYHIREFLTDVWPTDPPIPPKVDPVRFQSLDRLFTRSQWLPSIQKIGSVLSAGFPSDHYLLEAVVRVKLKSRPPKVPPPICYDYPSITHEQRYQFNQTFRRFHSNPSTTTPEINYTRKEWFIYTDGSGSNGRCSATTPAGWGFVVVEDGESIHEASGPVQADSHSPMFLGAMVGSNNTGETSAWMEAALYILTLDQPPIAVTFTYDSKWMAQAVQGTSRPTRHKTLVKNARQILWALQQKTAVHWEWVKGHSGHKHNELADQLAEKGKSQGCCHGGRQSLPRMATVETIASPVFTPAGSVSEKYAHFVNAINRAQESTLPVLLSRPRKPWITPQVATEMERVRQLRIRCSEDYNQAYKNLKKLARKLKRDWTRERLMEDTNTNHTKIWRVARQLKKGFQARRSRLKQNGKPVPWTKTHELFSEHLANIQWGPTTVLPEELELLDNSPQLHPPPTTPPAPFLHEELTTVLRLLRKNRAPGLDNLKAEALILLDYLGENVLLDLLNTCFRTRAVPEEWKQALVVNIYKGKGSESDPANYRPISLLNVLYKIYASMLQKRLATAHDKHLRSTQFGFRARRSTSDPAFILRRLQDYSAKVGQQFHILFLDWKQAFDKVDHSAMLIALRRLGVHPHYLAIIKDLYTDPIFCTQGYSTEKSWGKVHTGIRQGCPLSPYLFIMVMTVMFDDVDSRLRAHGIPQNTWSIGKPVYDLEYADDTALMAVSIPQLENFLHAVQVEATLYGLRLNTDKTELLVRKDYPAPQLSFVNGDPVPTTQEAKYLGSKITWTTPPKAAIKFRKDKAEAAFSKLYHVWCSKLPWKAKSIIFHSTIVPVLLYGLDICSLDKQHYKTIEAWYFRFLRRALSIKHSYYSRISNQRVWKAAGKPHIPSQKLLQQQFKLLIQCVTTPPSEPFHHVVFAPGYKDRVKFTKSKSRGHPARYWFELVSKEALRFLNHYLDYHALTGRKDFLGLKQLLQKDPKFGEYLATAPTRGAQYFPMYSKTVGGAWQS